MNELTTPKGQLLTTISAAITIALTATNGIVKVRVDNQAADVQRRDEALKERTAEITRKLGENAARLDALKEKTSRYTFLHTLLPELLTATGSRQLLTINLIRLTLDQEEAAQFFKGFTDSSDQTLKRVGTEGITALTKDRTASQQAADHERAAFTALINNDIDRAITEFHTTETLYPTFHDASELAHFLTTQRQDFMTAEGKKRIYSEILDRYYWKAPPDLITRLRNAIKE
jgi:hypothetical protein